MDEDNKEKKMETPGPDKTLQPPFMPSFLPTRRTGPRASRSLRLVPVKYGETQKRKKT
jgi:hypothetical protein